MVDVSITQIIVAAIVGGVVTKLLTLFWKRRARFIYTVAHLKVGTSTDDPVFGSIKVIHNDTPAKNLWLSTIELTNTSLEDFKDVPIQISATAPAILLNQTVKINDVFPHDLHLDKSFTDKLVASETGEYSDQQNQLYNSTRCFNFPSISRGDRLIFTYLTHTQEGMPELQLSINTPGILLVYRALANLRLDFGYTMLRGLGFGLMFSVPLLTVLTFQVLDHRHAAILGWILGLLTGSIGLFASKLWDKLRSLLFS